MIILSETPKGGLRSLLPEGRDATEWHALLAGEIEAHLSPAHAAILALPVHVAENISWRARATAMRRYTDLPLADREALMRAVTAILSDIRRLAQSGDAPSVTRCWPALREIPDLGMLFAADGRPVLAAWGSAPAGNGVARALLAEADDSRPPLSSQRPPWRRYAAAGITLGLLALLAGLILPLVPWLHKMAPVCSVDPSGVAALNARARADARHADLLAQLAGLVAQQGAQRLQCPLPKAPAPPAVKPALPQESWNRHDLGMLAGCWNKVSNLTVERISDGEVLGVASWKLCFDAQGRGTQTLVLNGGGTCTGGITASFQGDQVLMMTDPCIGPSFGRLVPQQNLCTRISDDEADCIGRDLEGQHSNQSDESRFRR